MRGVYYYGLRETCSQKCIDGPWPSFINLADAGANWSAVDKIEKVVEAEGKKGHRLEIRVTAVGVLKTRARHTPLGPCDRVGSSYAGYGHLGAFPAELAVRQFTNIEVTENPGSPYDDGSMYHGAL